MAKEVFEDTIIVGGGLAGLGCARRLYTNKHPFKMISPDIGGRVKVSPDGKVNYGAYYVTRDCNTIKPFMKLRRMNFHAYHFHEEKDEKIYYFTKWQAITRHFGAVMKLTWGLWKFRIHFNRMRAKSQEFSRQELIENDPLLKKYYHQKAGEYINERGLNNFVKEYCEQVLWASFFVNPREVPTFIFMQCMLPMIITSYEFDFKFDKIVAEFKDDIIKDEVKKVTGKDGLFILHTKAGRTFRCRKLVLATPMWMTNKLVKPQKIKRVINVNYYHVRGVLRDKYDKKGFNFFPLEEGTVVSHEHDGTFLYFYTGKDKIKKYFSKYTVITKKTWKPCLIILGDQYINLTPEKNLFLANDHDVAGTEDAFINGHYTAKLVLNSP